MGLYILDKNHCLKKAEDVNVWASWMEDKKNWLVAHEQIGQFVVSTYFFGGNQLEDGGKKPLKFFVTEVYGKNLDQPQGKYATWEEAKKGHKRIVAKIKKEGNV